VLGGLGSLAAAGLLAGCAGDDDSGDAPEAGGDGGGTAAGGDGSGAGYDAAIVDEYLSDAGNYDGTVVDEQGASSVTVAVGTEGNGGNYAYSPVAVVVDAGTTVQFEWTGKGQQHNIVDEDGEFRSDIYVDSGVHFEYSFDSSGTFRYFCGPHKSFGMKGVVAVV
jgi:halocyanin-like protein